VLLIPHTGCRDTGADQEADHAPASAGDTNRIDIPPAVLRNLGITFVTVEKRTVQGTIRIPGQFELRPEARREYHVMLPGRIELLVSQYEHVEAGQPLFHLESPEWQKIQTDMVSALNAMKKSHADLAVARAKEAEMKKAVAFLDQRISKLAQAEVRQVELEAERADKHNMLPRLNAEVEVAQTEFDAAHARYDVMLTTAASLTGIDRKVVDPTADEHEHLSNRQPAWRSITRLTIRAESSGIVDRMAVTNRGWAETGALILDTVDPTAVRFHGDALQTDINLFRDGQVARVVPPQGGSIDLQDTTDGTITVGFQANSEQRTIPVYLVPQQLPRWGKAGVTAYLEVFADGDVAPVLAIPEAAVIRDGLDTVFFRRDPADPNKVIRMDADLGASDGRWVAVNSGVMLGDEIVLSGVYPLMLASSEAAGRLKGGHFHADGTFHQDDAE
jgi:multidrug efflux pump subunit AcrA (membrane-fusion protein)